MQTYTADEIQQILAAVEHDRLGHVWYLALNGLRRGEICAIRWADVDFTKHTLTVSRNRVHTKNVVIEGLPKTRSSRRTLPLDSTLERVLRRAHTIQQREREIFGDEYVRGETSSLRNPARRTTLGR